MARSGSLAQAQLAEAQGRADAALALYRAAIKADPRDAEARFGQARLLARLDRLAEAAEAYAALLARAPANTAALAEAAWCQGRLGRFAAALDHFDRLEQLGADVAPGLAQVAFGLMHVCDWSLRDALTERLLARIARPEPCRFDPYVLLATVNDPAAHRRVAERIAGSVRDDMRAATRPAPRPIGGGRRLRVGYLCGDLNQHATSLLIAGVMEAHDRDRVETIALDHSREDGSATRTRMRAAFERFVPITTLSDAQAAARIASLGIDILVDLNGYNNSARAGILVLRPAPVQANFLGYVGTQGGDWTDYVIADDIVLPPDALRDWTEAPLWMPFSYYPNDRTRPLPMPETDRAAHGLPREGFVFACFNSPHKIAPEVFAVWLRLLHAAPGSVLWLYEGNAFVAANLRRAAAAGGVSPDRLVFAKPAELSAHLARHGCADLCLDTLPYGAHTTGADALWAGVPLLTCTGQSWASRVGASLLRAVGMEELATHSLRDYEALALTLARDPARLATLRERLIAVRETAPLFDATRFARDLERGYEAMADRHRQRLLPAPLRV